MGFTTAMIHDEVQLTGIALASSTALSWAASTGTAAHMRIPHGESCRAKEDLASWREKSGRGRLCASCASDLTFGVLGPRKLGHPHEFQAKLQQEANKSTFAFLTAPRQSFQLQKDEVRALINNPDAPELV